jgi:hypothetical protein
MATVNESRQRMTAVERAIADLQQRIGNKLDHNWLEVMKGAFANDPVFDEMVEYGRRAREASPYVDEE